MGRKIMAQPLEGAYTLQKDPAHPSLRLKAALPACPGARGLLWLGVPVLEIVELLLSLEVVSGVITVAGTPTKGNGGCSCPACGFCGG